MGLFITIEGGDGVGKTTQAELLFQWMKERDISCVLTKEPGSKHLEECSNIRELLLNPKYDIADSTELLLFLADRAQHVTKLIKPSLASGKYVICDRYIDSTRVYQSSRGFSRSLLDNFIDFATGGLQPNITILLDFSAEHALKRARAKSQYDNGDRMEKEDIKFHENIRNGFLKLANSFTESYRYKIINADKSIDDVHNEIVKIISEEIWGK